MNKPVLNATSRRLRAAHTIADLHLIARRRTSRVVFDYTDGAAEAELSLARARQAFRDIEFQPSILRDVAGRYLDDSAGRSLRHFRSGSLRPGSPG